MMPIAMPKMNLARRRIPRLVSTDSGLEDTKAMAVAAGE